MTAAADQAAEATAAAIAAWEDPPRGARRDAPPVLAVAGFTGPLDWLLEMVRAQKIDLARLSIAALIEAFAQAMTAALTDRNGVGHGRADPNGVGHRRADPSGVGRNGVGDRKSTRLNSSHVAISYAVFCLKKKKTHQT